MKQIDVVLEKGVPHGYKYELTGQGHEVPGAHAGDVIAVIKIKEHPVFTRKGADLLMDKSITLKEALTGFSFPVTQLDGEQIFVGCSPGEVVAPSLSR